MWSDPKRTSKKATELRKLAAVRSVEKRTDQGLVNMHMVLSNFQLDD